MALIAKIDPPIYMLRDGVARVHARPYEKPSINAGDEVFIWTAETSGGHGLAAHGTVLTSEIMEFANTSGSGTHKELILDVALSAQHCKQPLSLDQIAPDRDAPRATPTSAISRVLYKHSLNKIVAIDPEVSAFVRSHFEETR